MRFKLPRGRRGEPEPSPNLDDVLREVRKALRHQDNIFLRMQGLTALYEFLPLRNVLPLIPRASGAGSPVLLHRLVSDIMAVRARQGLECGSGVSTLIGGYAIELLGTGGRWTALEHDPIWHRRVTEWVCEHGLSETVEVVYAPLTEHELRGSPGERFEWYDVSRLKLSHPAQVLLIDGPPGQRNPNARYPAAHLLQGFVADGARAIVDDYSRQGERNMVKSWLRDGLISDVSTLPTAKGIAVGYLHSHRETIEALRHQREAGLDR